MKQRQDRELPNPPGPGARTTGSDGFRYRAFISYSHEDQPWANWLIKALETYRVPQRLLDAETSADPLPRRLTPIFRDRDELASASDLGDTIRGALADSANLIVICSPASANSHWVNEEIRAFQELGRNKRIFCLIVAGEPNASALPGQEYKECLAPALRQSHDASGASTHHYIEPAAADVRPGMDSKTAARLKLVAGLLGVGLDNLRRRDHQRRARRMVAVTALALVVTAVTTTLAITAFIARQSAKTAQKTAERRQKQAEDLVNFMLGDLNEKLTEVGRLDIMQSVDDKAMDYFALLPVTDVTDRSLSLRAMALQKIGLVRMSQGHFDKALKSFQLALDTNKQRLHKLPGDATRLEDYGYSLTYVGYAFYFKNDLAQAERYFQSAFKALDRALSTQPGDSDIQKKLVEVLNNLAQIQGLRNKPVQALANYEQQIALVNKLLARSPDDTRYITMRTWTGINISGLEFEQGQLSHSIRDLRDTLYFLLPIVAHDPHNRAILDVLEVSNAKFAQTLHAVGRHRLALQYIQRAVDTGDSQVRFDPKNLTWKLQLSLYSIWQARWQLETRPESPSARIALEQQRQMLAHLLTSNTKSTSVQRLLALTYLSQASAALANGHNRLAETKARLALSTLGPLSRYTRDQAKATRTACSAELLLHQLDRSKSQRAHALRALQLIEPSARNSKDPRNLSLWVAALLETGRRKQALPIVRELRKMGYRTPVLVALLARRHLSFAPSPDIEARLNTLLASRPGSTGTNSSRANTSKN